MPAKRSPTPLKAARPLPPLRPIKPSAPYQANKTDVDPPKPKSKK